MLSEALIERLVKLDVAALCDADKKLRVLDAGIRPMSGTPRLLGRAHTVFCRDDFLTVLKALNEAQPGEVLVVDAGGGPRAMAGELFATEARRRGLAGIVIDGACRDTAKLSALDFPMYARSVCPMAGTAALLFTTRQPVTCGGVTIAHGDIVFGDRDGIVIATEAELQAALSLAETIQSAEAIVLERLECGQDLFGMLNFTEHCRSVEASQPSQLRFVL